MRHPKRDYTNYKKLTVDSVSNSNAVVAGILLMIIFFVIKGTDTNHNYSNFQDIRTLLVVGIVIVSRLIFVPWIYKISKKVGKDEILWTIFGLLSPSITLIILGFSDLKVESKVAMNIVNNKREKFRKELFLLKQETSNNDELKQKIKDTKEKFNQDLQKKLKEYYK